MDSITATSVGLAPFSLKDAPALIERVFPAQKIGIEAQKERKAGAGQTLTALGSYWKGRKPLVLVRATVLASLLPATDKPEADLGIFDLLMRMDTDGMWRRSPEVTAAHVWASPAVSPEQKAAHLQAAGPAPSDTKQAPGSNRPSKKSAFTKWAPIPAGTAKTDAACLRAERLAMMKATFAALPFSRKIAISERVEAIEDLGSGEDPLYAGIWGRVNAHLGTTAGTLPELVEQLGVARFGQRPVVGDPFCGGGSIPFEAARIGCGAVASDLNPVAAMLTWGALNIIGADAKTRGRIAEEQHRTAAEVDAEITRLGLEHDAVGNRAKAYIYCLEVVDPQTGWRVPMAPSWVISANRRCVAKLVPDYGRKRFEILVETGVSAAEMGEATLGTVRDGHLVYCLAPIEGGDIQEYRVQIPRLRGDGEGPILPDGSRGNRLRLWSSHDIVPQEPVWSADAAPVVTGAPPGAWINGDIWLERLYAIQWLSGADLRAGKTRPETWFTAPGPEDFRREAEVLANVQQNFERWRSLGFVPDMRIEPGAETTRLIRERGWMHWHHLFGPRHLLLLALIKERVLTGPLAMRLCSLLNRTSRLTQWHVGHGGRDGSAPSADQVDHVFYNQALNVSFNYASRSWPALTSFLVDDFPSVPIHSETTVALGHASNMNASVDLWIYDPPYADAVHYHEITEFFIVWLRKNPPSPFNHWTWDSRRPLAIQGKGEKFRTDMVAALRAMAAAMPDQGLQVCMFTHKDAGVWADMAGIVWAAGLRVTAAWYVSTETTSDLKKGGYVQGTVLLVLRKRVGDEHGYRSDVVPEVRARVAAQVETLTGLNQSTEDGARDENLFSDSDIQMAGYAAALEVLTGYTHIDGVDMTREALRPREARRRGSVVEIGIVEEMISLAVQTANEMMIPTGLPDGMWERLGSTERFYLKMTASEAVWPAGATGGKLDDYQNFAKAYRADGWEDLMADRLPNRARLKSAAEFRGGLLNGHPISSGALRPTLYAIMCLARDAEKEADPTASGAQALHGLRDHFGGAEWLRARDNIRTLAAWLGRTWERRNPAEAAAARVLASLVATERL